MIRLLLALALTTALAASAAEKYRIPQTSEAWKKWKAAGYVTTIEEIVAATRPTDNPAVEKFIESDCFSDIELVVTNAGVYSDTLNACIAGQLAALQPIIKKMDALPELETYTFKFDWNRPPENRLPWCMAFRYLTTINCMRLQYYIAQMSYRYSDSDDRNDPIYSEASSPAYLLLDNLRWAHVLCGNSEHLSITVGTSVANKTVSYLPIMFPFLSDERLKEIEQQCAAIISVRRESYAKYVEYFSISFMLYMPAKAIKDVAEEPNTAQEAAIFSMLASCEKPFDCKLEELMYTIPCLGKPYYKIKNDATLKNFAAKDFDQSTFGNTVASMLYTFTIGITGFFARSTDLLNRTRILCALELYRRANGAWPDKLDSLVPEFLPKLPISELTGKPFEYRHGEIEYSERHFDFRNGRVICGETVTRTVDGVMLPASKCNDDYDIDVAALTPLPEEK